MICAGVAIDRGEAEFALTGLDVRRRFPEVGSLSWDLEGSRLTGIGRFEVLL